MEKLYYFFDLDYETVSRPPNTPYRLLLTSVGYVGFHWHGEAELLFILDGEVRVQTEGGNTTLSGGDLMVLKPNELHGFVEVSPNLMLVVQVEEGLFGQHANGESMIYPLPPTAPVRAEVLTALKRDLARMAREVWEKKTGYESMSLAALHHALGLLQREVARSTESKDHRVLDDENRRRIQKVVDFLHSHSSHRISLSDVAKHINVSPSYASHLITKGTGRSMQENLNLIRTGKAVDLLMKTDRKLVDIALSVGFSDPKYFNQYFRKLFGCTPKDMKRRPNWEQAILSHYGDDGLDPTHGAPYLSPYWDWNPL